MKRHLDRPLINPTWDQIVEREPLIAFSNYLSGRVNVLFDITSEIVENLDIGFSAELVHGGKITRAETLMWLWTLGAYEVVRTMCQAKACFSDRILSELISLKKTLATVRMPAAKMEKAGRNEPVTSDRSPSGWDLTSNDLIVGDPEESTAIQARALLSEFERIFSSIEPQDILDRHEASYPPS